jgi:hypothetical protein
LTSLIVAVEHLAADALGGIEVDEGLVAVGIAQQAGAEALGDE